MKSYHQLNSMKKAIKLYLREGTAFDVLFDDGITKRYDILMLADKFPQLNALKDRELFLQGHLLGWGGIVWNDDLDVESETVYEDGLTINNDDNVAAILAGYKLKELRRNAGLTQAELSNACGVPQTDISRIEKGQFNPSISMLQKIASGINKKVIINFR